MYHVEGLPFGTRGGLLIKHEFPADGEYVFKVVPVNEGNMGQANRPFGADPWREARSHDRRRARASLRLGQGHGGLRRSIRRADSSHPRESGSAHGRSHLSRDQLRAGQQQLEPPVLADHDSKRAGSRDYVFFPHVGKVRIEGPFDAPASSDTPSRRKILACRPTSEKDEESCARQTLSDARTREPIAVR